MDIWVGSNPRNAEKLSTCLQKFGFAPASVPPDKFQVENCVFQMGVPPVRIDILTTIAGLEFDSSFPKREQVVTSGTTINIISLEDLKTNKRASGRPKDLGDLDNLSE